MKIISTFLTYIELTITLGMPLTKEEQLAQRRERDASLRQEKREILAQHPILLKENTDLKMRILQLEKENAQIGSGQVKKLKSKLAIEKSRVKYWKLLAHPDHNDIFDYYYNYEEAEELIKWYEKTEYSNYLEPDFKEKWKNRFAEDYPNYPKTPLSEEESDDDFTI